MLMREANCYILTILLTLIAMAACSDADRGTLPDTPLRLATAGPVLVLADTIILQESDSIYVGSPGTNFAVDTRGTIYIPDRSIDAVLQFSPSGLLDRVIGRKGSGPGELRGVGATIEAGQSLLAVRGHRNLRVSFSAIPSGSFVGSFRYRGYLSALAERQEEVWFGTMDLDSGKMFGWFNPLEATRREESPWLEGKIIDIPVEYSTFPGLDIYGLANVLPIGDSLLVGFGGLNYVLLTTPSGTILDTIHLPVWKRRGVPIETLRRVFRAPSGPPSETFSAISSLAGLWAASDGSVFVYHRDLAISDPSVRNSPTVGRAYISILSPDLTRACVDGEIVFPEPTYPVIDVQHDTVYALDQTILPGTSPRTQTVVRKYVVDESSCDWVDLR